MRDGGSREPLKLAASLDSKLSLSLSLSSSLSLSPALAAAELVAGMAKRYL